MKENLPDACLEVKQGRKRGFEACPWLNTDQIGQCEACPFYGRFDDECEDGYFPEDEE